MVGTIYQTGEAAMEADTKLGELEGSTLVIENVFPINPGSPLIVPIIHENDKEARFIMYTLAGTGKRLHGALLDAAIDNLNKLEKMAAGLERFKGKKRSYHVFLMGYDVDKSAIQTTGECEHNFYFSPHLEELSPTE